MSSGLNSSTLDEPMCPHCIRPVTLQHHFCPHCNAPLTSYATSGPYEQVLAQGYAVRAGGVRPANLLVLVGMWLIFAPTLIIAAISIAGYLLESRESLAHTPAWRFAALVPSGVWVALAGFILWKSTRNYFRPFRDSCVGTD